MASGLRYLPSRADTFVCELKPLSSSLLLGASHWPISRRQETVSPPRSSQPQSNKCVCVHVCVCVCVCVCAQLLSRVWLFVTPWTVTLQAPLSMGFSRQENWSELPFPSPGDLPYPGSEPGSPALQADSLLSESPGKHMTQKFSFGYIPKVIESRVSKPYLYTHVHSSFIHYSWNTEANQVCIDEWIDDQNVVYAHNGI